MGRRICIVGRNSGGDLVSSVLSVDCSFFSEIVACKVCLFMIMSFVVYMIICNVGKWKVCFLVSLFLLG